MCMWMVPIADGFKNMIIVPHMSKLAMAKALVLAKFWFANKEPSFTLENNFTEGTTELELFINSRPCFFQP